MILLYHDIMVQTKPYAELVINIIDQQSEGVLKYLEATIVQDNNMKKKMKSK